MTNHLLTCLFIAFGILTLVAWPILAFPTLPGRRKALLLALTLFVLTPAAIGVYLWASFP